MEKAPFFSVILPTYNRAELLTHAVQSVIDQTFEDWELIIVDDGSTDNTRELLDTLDDSRVRYIKQENQGKGGARNTGLKFTRGQYVCFLDSDDIFYKDHLNVLKDGIHENATFKMYRTGICWNVKSGIKCQKLLNLQSKKEQISYLWNNYFSLINLCINADLAKFEVFEAYPLWQDKQYIQKLLLKEEYIQLATCTVQIYEGPERSVNRAFENWDIVEGQLDCIKASYSYLLERNALIGKEISLTKTIVKALWNHAMNAKSENNKYFYDFYVKKIFGYSRTLKTYLRLIKNSIF